MEECFKYLEQGKKYTEKLIKQAGLDRIYSDQFKKDCAEVLNNFIKRSLLIIC